MFTTRRIQNSIFPVSPDILQLLTQYLTIRECLVNFVRVNRAFSKAVDRGVTQGRREDLSRVFLIAFMYSRIKDPSFDISCLLLKRTSNGSDCRVMPLATYDAVRASARLAPMIRISSSYAAGGTGVSVAVSVRWEYIPLVELNYEQFKELLDLNALEKPFYKFAKRSPGQARCALSLFADKLPERQKRVRKRNGVQKLLTKDTVAESAAKSCAVKC